MHVALIGTQMGTLEGLAQLRAYLNVQLQRTGAGACHCGKCVRVGQVCGPGTHLHACGAAEQAALSEDLHRIVLVNNVPVVIIKTPNLQGTRAGDTSPLTCGRSDSIKSRCQQPTHKTADCYCRRHNRCGGHSMQRTALLGMAARGRVEEGVTARAAACMAHSRGPCEAPAHEPQCGAELDPTALPYRSRPHPHAFAPSRVRPGWLCQARFRPPVNLRERSRAAWVPAVQYALAAPG